MLKKTYTIFGHTGFIGSALKNKLKTQNLILPEKKELNFKKNLGNIIYCIGSDLWKKDIYNSYYANLGLIPDIIKKNKFSTFTFLSSIRIYNNSKSSKEESNLYINPNYHNDYYNIKKICAESYLLSSKKKIKIIRLTNLYGENYYAPIVLPTFIRSAIKKGEILISINKNSLKDYLSIDDAINIILKIIQSGKENIYNVASGKRISLISIANEIKKITNCKIIFANQGEKINEKLINISKIKKEFNFKPSTSLLKDLNHLVKKFSNNL
ncbi:NAD-dependent epimerase/dehydratase family protein [Candidatus Fonsibacter ubiquis]|uniref:NAD-dependent epimerase/dehydratase family protein n=1 Tax=Candidatus Fonsibacter ubiquis TaxID=1925548 RepID=UPI000C068940|nr:NAD-dependent epimerase/dehydratase family protein [Candidatus Fonsibacter ubiquis]